MAKKVTLSVIKADVGSSPGHVESPPELIEVCEQRLDNALEDDLINDFYITRCGDDIELIMTHNQGTDSDKIHQLAWDSFNDAALTAKDAGLYGAGQDLLKDTFSGNVKGMGPGVAEMEFEERPSEPVVVFAADKTDPGAFSLPFYKIFADPFSTAGLVIDPKMRKGFSFEVHDVKENKKIMIDTPEENLSLLALIGTTSRYLIKRIYRRSDDEIAGAVSTEKLSKIAGKYVGKDDPVAISRAQSGFPAVGEVLEPFSFPHLAAGWMRGSHRGPVLPVSELDAVPSRFDGPPRIMALGFTISDGVLVGPKDLFADVAFDRAREKGLEVADYMRQHGPFEPHRLSEKEMEYTTLPQVLDDLEDRFEQIE